MSENERKPDPRWTAIKARMDNLRETERIPTFAEYQEFLRMFLLERQTFDGRDGLNDLTNARFAFTSIMGEIMVRDERIDQQAARIAELERTLERIVDIATGSEALTNSEVEARIWRDVLEHAQKMIGA